jgi:hypothetical protein
MGYDPGKTIYLMIGGKQGHPREVFCRKNQFIWIGCALQRIIWIPSSQNDRHEHDKGQP